MKYIILNFKCGGKVKLPANIFRSINLPEYLIENNENNGSTEPEEPNPGNPEEPLPSNEEEETLHRVGRNIAYNSIYAYISGNTLQEDIEVYNGNGGYAPNGSYELLLDAGVNIGVELEEEEVITGFIVSNGVISNFVIEQNIEEQPEEPLPEEPEPTEEE